MLQAQRLSGHKRTRDDVDDDVEPDEPTPTWQDAEAYLREAMRAAG